MDSLYLISFPFLLMSFLQKIARFCRHELLRAISSKRTKVQKTQAPFCRPRLPLHVSRIKTCLWCSLIEINSSADTGRLRLNLNPLNLVRWIDSWPFDKTWKPGWNDSTWVNWFNGQAMNLEWIFIMTPSHAWNHSQRCCHVVVFLYYICTEWVRLRRGRIQCRSIISHDFRRFSRTTFTRWIFYIFNRRRPLCFKHIFGFFEILFDISFISRFAFKIAFK